MKRLLAITSLGALIASLMLSGLMSGIPVVAADECRRGSLRGNLLSHGSEAKLSISGNSYRCHAPSVQATQGTLGPVYSFEVLCNSNSNQGPGTLCSDAPCVQADQSFALRNIRYPDGRTEPAGFQCLNPRRAEAKPGVTFAQLFSAIRSVRLPGGRIHGTPAARGLANLRSFFWVDGVLQEPVELSIAGSVLYAEFRVVEYRWAFGSGEPLVTKGPGSPGIGSEVSTTFQRRGTYRVGVTVMWVAEAYLDGRRVGEVDALVSRAQTTYPVAELRTVLTG